MLDREKLVEQLEKIGKDLSDRTLQGLQVAQKIWDLVGHDFALAEKIKKKKWSILVPTWDGMLASKCTIEKKSHPYSVLAVDGSQIYYDKHQGPACFLINIGSVLLEYGDMKSSVQLSSKPYVFTHSDQGFGVEIVNAKREQFELNHAVKISQQKLSSNDSNPYLCLFDGTLIFFNTDSFTSDDKQEILQNYFEQLDQLFQKKILHAGYISFPRSKDLLNIIRIVAAGFDEVNIANTKMLDQLTDMDIASFFLEPGQRSLLFASKAPVTYAYPQYLKPYFCYLHVGFEIIRLEIPQWIAQQESQVNLICSMVFDQASKGRGYPVCLFEAHEQAVIKSIDREFFYIMMQKFTQKNQGSYQASYKSMKKLNMPV